MRKLKIIALIVLAVLGLAPVASAQLGPDLLLMGGLKLADSVIAQHSQSSASPGKHVYDVYLDDNAKDVCGQDGKPIRDPSKLHYFFSVDSSVAAQIAFGDRVVLKVKSFKNGGPPHDLTLYVNDRNAHDLWRKVDGNGRGVEGDYPFVWIRDLQPGTNQLKTRFSRNEWCESEVIRIDLRAYYALKGNEDNLLQVAMGGHLGYPYTPVYTTVFPDGSVRAFGSEQEAGAALEQLNQQVQQGFQGGQTPPEPTPAKSDSQPVMQTPVREQQVRQPQDQDLNPNPQDADQGQGITVFGGPYTPTMNLTTDMLTQRALRHGLDVSKPVPIRRGQHAFLVLRSTETFHVMVKNPRGKNVIDRDAVRKGDVFQFRLDLTFADGITDTMVYVNDQKAVAFKESYGGQAR